MPDPRTNYERVCDGRCGEGEAHCAGEGVNEHADGTERRGRTIGARGESTGMVVVMAGASVVSGEAPSSRLNKARR